MQYGMPAIGDLFKSRPQDIQETINSVYYMLKQRIADIDNRNEFRQKITRAEQQSQDSQLQLQRAKTKTDQMAKEIVDLKNQLKNSENKHKAEMAKLTSERDELIKQITKIEHKEGQYRHEIRSRELQVSKLQDQLKAKLLDKKGGPGGAVHGKENA